MPITFNIDIPARRREQQALDALERQRQAQQELIGSMLPDIPRSTMAGGLDFGQRPTISPEQALSLQALQPEQASTQALKMLEQQRLQQQAQAQQQQLAQALQSEALGATPELEAVRSLVAAGATPEQLKAFGPHLDPFTLGTGQQRFGGTGGEIAVGPEKLADLEAKRNKMFDQSTKLRGEFTGITKPYEDQNQAYGRVIASAQDTSPAGDLALIFNFMKVLDPGSTVREGEFAQVGAAGGLPTQVQRIFDSWVTGKKLTDSQRADVVNRAGKLFEQASKQHKKTAEEFRALAIRNKLDPRDVIFQRQTVDVLPPLGGGTDEPPPGAQ